METFGEERHEAPLEDDGRWKRPDWSPSREKPLPPVRCTAINEKGMQCANTSATGSIKCGAHSSGAELKNAQERVVIARLRLVGLVDEAIDGLAELIQVGSSESVRLKAIENVLDRTGLTKGQDINIQVEQSNNAAEMVQERLLAIRERKKADMSRQEEEIIEAEEVVGEDD